jgi:hypothetical protein
MRGCRTVRGTRDGRLGSRDLSEGAPHGIMNFNGSYLGKIGLRDLI